MRTGKHLPKITGQRHQIRRFRAYTVQQNEKLLYRHNLGQQLDTLRGFSVIVSPATHFYRFASMPENSDWTVTA